MMMYNLVLLALAASADSVTTGEPVELSGPAETKAELVVNIESLSGDVRVVLETSPDGSCWIPAGSVRTDGSGALVLNPERLYRWARCRAELRGEAAKVSLNVQLVSSHRLAKAEKVEKTSKAKKDEDPPKAAEGA